MHIPPAWIPVTAQMAVDAAQQGVQLVGQTFRSLLSAVDVPQLGERDQEHQAAAETPTTNPAVTRQLVEQQLDELTQQLSKIVRQSGLADELPLQITWDGSEISVEGAHGGTAFGQMVIEQPSVRSLLSSIARLSRTDSLEITFDGRQSSLAATTLS